MSVSFSVKFHKFQEVDLSDTVSDIDIPDDYADISDVDDIKASEEDIKDLDKLLDDAKQGTKSIWSELKVYCIDENDRRSVAFEKRNEPRAIQRDTVIDDFIRNFLIKYKLKRTLDSFQVRYSKIKSINV